MLCFDGTGCWVSLKRLIENSYASAGLILHIILGKFCDHLPLYRQEQIFKQGFSVEIRASGYIQANETHI